jgi:radical SAM superfamily enzyme YgiQ (UPF0313 family)
MKKVLLVNCNTEKTPYPVPPLGLCLLSASLGDKWNVSIFDCTFNECDGLVDRVIQFNPDYIGFSIRNIDNTIADNFIYYVDAQIENIILPVKKMTSAKIILGGSGFSIFPQELMELTKADYGIIGEAETAFYQLLNALDKGEEVKSTSKVIVRKEIKRKHRSNSSCSDFLYERFSEIDTMIDFTPYRDKGAYSIQTKRGCSHGCIYCTYPWLEGTKFRTRNPRDIVDEIEQAYDRLGDIVFEFVDSTFNDPLGHAEVICNEIIRRRLKLRLRTMGINPRNSSDKLFELMMASGFAQIDATPDTASPTLLTNLRKGFELREVRQMANSIKKFNLPTMWFFLFGGPGENEKTFNETIDFVDQYVNPEDLVYMASGLRIYPNTPLEKTALKDNVIRPGQSLMFPPVFYYSREISKDQLAEFINEVSSKRVNCVNSSNTRPSGKMLAEANKMKTEQKLNEPMFRTLLRIRREWRTKGLL